MKGLTSTGSSSVESRLALRRFFAWLESSYGGLVLDPSEVITKKSPSLQGEDLRLLMNHEVIALHVKGFYPKKAAMELGRKLAQESETKRRIWKVSTTRGLETSDVATLGEHPPFNVATALGQEDDYFEGVHREFQLRRFGCVTRNDREQEDCQEQDELSLCLWPLDLLRLRLDELWPSGAGLARNGVSGKPYSGGLPRIMKGPSQWKQGFIHVDEMGPLNSQLGLFSANIYLQLPEDEEADNSGKNRKSPATSKSNDSISDTDAAKQDMLRIWPLGIRNRWDWYRNAFTLSGLSSQDAEDQIRLRYLLGEPITISCEPGDLVLLCVQRPHAAVGFSRGTRVSLQCFIQHKGSKARLEIDI